jgi:hypothetical protein
MTIFGGRFPVAAPSRPRAGLYRAEISALRKTGEKTTVVIPFMPPGTTADEEVETVPARYTKNSVLRQER